MLLLAIQQNWSESVNSNMDKISNIPFILIAVTVGVSGQLMVKKGINVLGSLDFSSRLFHTYTKIFLSPVVLLGSITYAASVFFWVYALTKVDLSFAYPFLGLSYVLILLCSWVFLGEYIPLIRWVGVLVICLGVFLVAKS